MSRGCKIDYGVTVLLGFASFSDSSFELIVMDAESGFETTLRGKLDIGQLEVISKILPTSSYVKARA